MFTRCTLALFSTLGLCLAPAVAHDQIVVDAGRGPVTVYIPDSYDPAQPLPVILLLHGLSSTGALVEGWLDYLSVIDEKQFIYAHPEGTSDPDGSQFWNATDACCNLTGGSVDDSQYLSDLLDEIALNLSVDPRRIHCSGHSNGGFMSYRLACDRSSRIASIASISGATWKDPAQCSPDQPVHVLQVHGTLDGTILFGGGTFFGALYPSAVESVEQWGGFASCALAGVTQPTTFDYVSNIAGPETSVTVYDTFCEPGGSAELWTVQDAPHVPPYNASFAPAVIDWLLAHPKTPGPVTYCTAGVSASGCTATLQSIGTPSASEMSGFVLAAHGVEGLKDGLFFYGFSGRQANPWGGGTSVQCVVPPVMRTEIMMGQGTPGECNGSFLQDFNEFWSSAPAAKAPAPGSQVWMQLWYRDPQNTSNQTTSLSNALELTVAG